ncbi:MAG: DICT sensory domain-containing protein [Cyanobacteria bacterium P01_F01_bin.4]
MMDISLFRSIANQYKHIRSVNTVSMMNTISHLIEDQIIQHRLPVDLYAGFQKFSNFPEQMRRYGRLGAICRRVYVYGIPDYPPPSIPGVEFIELSPSAELAKEWFLLVNTSDFWATLIARETLGTDRSTGGRKFDGIWSYDQQVAERISLLLSQVMGGFYEPVTTRNHERQSEHVSEISGNMLAQLEQSELLSQRRWTQLLTLQKTSEVCNSRSANLVQHVADILHDLFGATGVAIALKKNAQEYSVLSVAGEAECKGWLISSHNGISGQVLDQARLIHIPDIEQQSQREVLLPRAKSLIVAPIAHRSMFGMVAVGHSEAQTWTDEDAQTVAAAANCLAVYLSRVTQWVPKTKLSALSLDPSTRFRQYISENQRSLAHLVALHRKLQALDNLSEQQKDMLRQLEDSYRQLIGVSNQAKKTALEAVHKTNNHNSPVTKIQSKVTAIRSS